MEKEIKCGDCGKILESVTQIHTFDDCVKYKKERGMFPKCKHEWRQRLDSTTMNCMKPDGYYCVHCLKIKLR